MSLSLYIYIYIRIDRYIDSAYIILYYIILYYIILYYDYIILDFIQGARWASDEVYRGLDGPAATYLAGRGEA